ncbi:MAG TPA: NlpC/P60 family protein [Acidimicrobiia bacterium]|nr:NlpC/P60 family protein [Acidimicrobiia bacterium]
MAPLGRVRGARLIVGLLIACSVVPFSSRAQAQEGIPDDALAEQLAEKRAEAARIADEVEEIGTRASIALEAYRQGQVLLEEADVALFEARRRVEELRGHYEATRELADSRIVDMYQGQDAPDPLTMFDAKNAQDLGSRQHYTSVVAARDRRALGLLRVRRADLAKEERRVERQRDEVAAQTEALKEQKVTVEAAMADRRSALDRAQGELAALVAEEQQRRQAAEEARQREAARRRAEADARRRAEEEARRAATTTTAPGAPPASVGPTPTTTAAAAPPSEPSGPAPPVHPRAGEAVQAAMDKLGAPYQWGANGPDSFDCSGLTSYAWAAVGVRIPRSSGMQKAGLPPVGLSAIAPGDLLFFGTPVHHVGMYIGDAKMVNAPFTGDYVRIDSIYRRDFVGAARPG